MKAAQVLCLGLTASISLCLTVVSSVAHAQLVPDTTLESESSVVRLGLDANNLPTDLIEGGAVRGSNLFHSFSDFNVNKGQAVYFANPAFIESIFSRVTGENQSNILGQLGVEGSADLYLLNPNGVFFGPEASLDIEGSLWVSTAESIGFADGNEFGTTDLEDTPLLTISVPLGLQANYISSSGSSIENSGDLSIGEGEVLSFTGGLVQNSGTIRASGGTVQLVGNQVELINGSEIDVSNANGGGQVFIGQDASRTLVADSVQIGQNTLVNASADVTGQGGQVIIWSDSQTNFSGLILARGGEQLGDGGFVEVSGKNGLIYNGTVDAGATQGIAGTLLIDPTNIEIVGVGFDTSDLADTDQFSDPDLSAGVTRIAASAISGSLSNVILEATQNVVFNSDVDILIPGIGIAVIAGNDIVLNSSVQTSGGGEISLNAGRNINLTNQASFVRSYGEDVRLAAGGTISLQNGAQVDTAPFFGDSGNIIVNAPQLILTDGAQMKVAPPFGGAGGNLDLNISEKIQLSGIGLDSFGNPVSAGLVTSDLFSGGFGESGTVDISTPKLSITNGASIGAQTAGGLATGGSITIRDAELVEVAGFASSGAGELLSGIFASPDASGLASSIEIETERLVVRDGGLISISADGSGATGSLVIDGTSILLANSSAAGSPSGLIANALGLGAPGTIKIMDAQRVEVTGGATIDVSSLFSTPLQRGAIEIGTEYLELSDRAMFRVNNAGVLRIDASDAVTINNSTLSGNNVFGGSAGLISIRTGNLDITEQGLITTSSFNAEESGEISIQVNDTFNLDNSFVTASADVGNGFGGNIFVRARNFNLINRSRLDSGASAQGSAGTIDIEVDSLLLRNQSEVSVSGIEAQSQTGDLNIRANFARLEDGSKLEAVAPSTSGGNISLTLGNLLVLRNGSLISAEAGTESANILLTPSSGLGNGGDVSIRVPFVVAIPDENSDITANAFLGDGGRVDITARGLFGIEFRNQRTTQSDITASSEFGLNGIVELNAPDTSFLQDSLSELPDSLINSEQLVSTSCIARRDTQTGNLIVNNSSGLPDQPSTASAASFSTGDVQSVVLEGAALQREQQVVEPEAVYQLADGRLLMSRGCE